VVWSFPFGTNAASIGLRLSVGYTPPRGNVLSLGGSPEFGDREVDIMFVMYIRFVFYFHWKNQTPKINFQNEVITLLADI